jgi:hypothetical protein
MAFKPIQPKDIVACLKQLDPPFRQRKNALKCLTVGLTDCYSSIALQSNASTETSSLVSYAQESSYVDDAQIGSGAFAVVTRSYNSSGQVFAIKKVDSKFMLLALREVIFLRFMQQKTTRGGDFCE